jgi:hypothetical protein
MDLNRDDTYQHKRPIAQLRSVSGMRFKPDIGLAPRLA